MVQRRPSWEDSSASFCPGPATAARKDLRDRLETVSFKLSQGDIAAEGDSLCFGTVHGTHRGPDWEMVPFVKSSVLTDV